MCMVFGETVDTGGLFISFGVRLAGGSNGRLSCVLGNGPVWEKLIACICDTRLD